MNDFLESSSYSLDQAKRRLAELNKLFGDFGNSQPYRQIIETNADGTEDTFKVIATKPMPNPLRGVAFEVVSHLRAALDQAARSCAIAAGKNGRRIKAKFPFGDNPKEVEGRATGDSKDVPKEIFDVMLSLKPHKGGDDALWALNKVCNAGKHDIVVPLPLATGECYTGYLEVCGDLDWPPKWNAAKNEMVLFTVRHGVKPKYNLQIQILVVIGKVNGVEGTPALQLFGAATESVENALAAIRTKATEIGLA